MHRKNAHEDQRAIQVFIVFLDKVAVVIVGCTMKLIVELDGGVASRPEGGLKEGWECLKHSFLQAETIGSDQKGSKTEREVHATYAFGSILVSPIAGYQEMWFVRGGGRIQIGSRVLVCSAMGLHAVSTPPKKKYGLPRNLLRWAAGGYMPILWMPPSGGVCYSMPSSFGL